MMSTNEAGRYRFATAAQWATCATLGLPEDYRFGPADGEPVGGVPADASALAVGPDGTVYWVGQDGAIRRDHCPGPRLRAPKRLAAGQRSLIALGVDALLTLDAATLETVAVSDGAGLDDVALSSNGLVVRLGGDRIEQARRDGGWSDAPNQPDQRLAAIAFAGETLVGLARTGTDLLLWLNGLDQPPASIAIEELGDSDFVAAGLSGSADAALLWGGSMQEQGFLLVDPSGSLIARGAWKGQAMQAGIGGRILVAQFAGPTPSIRRYRQIGGGGVRMLTPALEADTLLGAWRRADLVAILPEGATLSARWAATRDETLPARIATLLAEDGRPIAARLAAVSALLDWQPAGPIVYRGERGDGPPEPQSFAVPLIAAAGHLLWLDLSLHRNDAETEPAMVSLDVLHDSPGLIDSLPAVFRSPDGDGDGTLGRLVGILEASTEALDAEIASLAERLDPARTENRWLPGLAGLLGLPFDNALSPVMQRDLVKAAPALLTGRGTRGGLRALIEALFPGRGIRIVDTTDRQAVIALGSTSLPAFLTGPSERTPRLNARLVLGRTALCGPGENDGQVTPPAPEVIVFVPATGGERRRFGAAIEQMLSEMVPAGVRLRVRWTAPQAAGGDDPDMLAIADAPVPLRLGEGQALGRALVGGDRRPRLRDGGYPLEHRMR